MMKRIALGFGFGLWVAAYAMAEPKPFVPEPLQTFDGSKWSGIQLGTTTDGDIKRLFGTRRGAIRPEAVWVRTAEGTPFRLDALLDGRGEKARVIGLQLTYPNGGPVLSDFSKAIGLEPEVFYPRDRFEDWSIVTYPSKGMAFFTFGTIPSERIATGLLVAPARIPTLVQGMSKEPTPITTYNPRITDDELLVEYGTINVNVTTSKATIRDRRRLEDDVEDELMRRSRARYLDYDRRGRGSVSATVAVRWGERTQRMEIEVTLSASGTNKLGTISVSGSSIRRWSRVANQPTIDSNRDILSVLDDARDELERNFDAAVRNQRPPTKEQIRNAEWSRIINQATR